jgi:hypothetical protein
LFVSINFVSFMRAHPNFIHKIPSTKIQKKIICFMLVISFVSYVGLKALWLFNAIAYLMSLQFWGGGNLHVTCDKVTCNRWHDFYCSQILWVDYITILHNPMFPYYKWWMIFGWTFMYGIKFQIKFHG